MGVHWIRKQALFPTAGIPTLYFPGWAADGNFERGILYSIYRCEPAVDLPAGSRSYEMWDVALGSRSAEDFGIGLEYEDQPWAEEFVPMNMSGMFMTDSDF